MANAIIHVAEFETTFASAQNAGMLHARIQAHIEQTLLPMIEDIVGRVAGGRELSLNTLELDLGSFTPDDLEAKLTQAFSEHLADSLNKGVQQLEQHSSQMQTGISELEPKDVSAPQAGNLIAWLVSVSHFPDSTERPLYATCREAVSKLFEGQPQVFAASIGKSQLGIDGFIVRLKNILTGAAWQAVLRFQTGQLSGECKRILQQFRSLVSKLDNAGLLRETLADRHCEIAQLAFTLHKRLDLLLLALGRNVLSLPTGNLAWPLLAELKTHCRLIVPEVEDLQANWFRALARALKTRDQQAITELWQSIHRIEFDGLITFFRHFSGLGYALDTLAKALTDNQLLSLVNDGDVLSNAEVKYLLDRVTRVWGRAERDRFWIWALHYRFVQGRRFAHQLALLTSLARYFALERKTNLARLTAELAQVCASSDTFCSLSAVLALLSVELEAAESLPQSWRQDTAGDPVVRFETMLEASVEQHGTSDQSLLVLLDSLEDLPDVWRQRYFASLAARLRRGERLRKDFAAPSLDCLMAVFFATLPVDAGNQAAKQWALLLSGSEFEMPANALADFARMSILDGGVTLATDFPAQAASPDRLLSDGLGVSDTGERHRTGGEEVLPQAFLRRCLNPAASQRLRELATELGPELREQLFARLDNPAVTLQDLCWLYRHVAHDHLNALILIAGGDDASLIIRQAARWCDDLVYHFRFDASVSHSVAISLLYTYLDQRHCWTDSQRIQAVVCALATKLALSPGAVKDALRLTDMPDSDLCNDISFVVRRLGEVTDKGISKASGASTPGAVPEAFFAAPEQYKTRLTHCLSAYPAITAQRLLPLLRKACNRYTLKVTLGDKALLDLVRALLANEYAQFAGDSWVRQLYSALKKRWQGRQKVCLALLDLIGTHPIAPVWSGAIETLIRTGQLAPALVKKWHQVAALDCNLPGPDDATENMVLAADGVLDLTNRFAHEISRGGLVPSGLAMLEEICRKAPMTGYRLIHELVNGSGRIIGMDEPACLKQLLDMLATIVPTQPTPEPASANQSASQLYQWVTALKALCPEDDSAAPLLMDELPGTVSALLRASLSGALDHSPEKVKAVGLEGQLLQALHGTESGFLAFLQNGAFHSLKEHEISRLFSQPAVYQQACDKLSLAATHALLRHIAGHKGAGFDQAAIDYAWSVLDALMFATLRLGWSNRTRAERLAVATLIEVFLVARASPLPAIIMAQFCAVCRQKMPGMAHKLTQGGAEMLEVLQRVPAASVKYAAQSLLQVLQRSGLGGRVELPDPDEAVSPHLLEDNQARQEADPEEELVVSFASVSNAGLVILQPFIPTLLERLGLMSEGRFNDEQAGFQAVNLLQAVVGQTDFFEPDLVLNKLFCGISPQTPVPLIIEHPDEHLALIRELLQMVIQRWEILGETSVAGLQESFLRREGVLTRLDDVWQLEVSAQPFDMLLDKLPWGMRTIKYSWMAVPIQVNWRNGMRP